MVYKNGCRSHASVFVRRQLKSSGFEGIVPVFKVIKKGWLNGVPSQAFLCYFA